MKAPDFHDLHTFVTIFCRNLHIYSYNCLNHFAFFCACIIDTNSGAAPARMSIRIRIVTLPDTKDQIFYVWFNKLEERLTFFRCSTNLGIEHDKTILKERNKAHSFKKKLQMELLHNVSHKNVKLTHNSTPDVKRKVSDMILNKENNKK